MPLSGFRDEEAFPLLQGQISTKRQSGITTGKDQVELRCDRTLDNEREPAATLSAATGLVCLRKLQKFGYTVPSAFPTAGCRVPAGSGTPKRVLRSNPPFWPAAGCKVWARNRARTGHEPFFDVWWAWRWARSWGHAEGVIWAQTGHKKTRFVGGYFFFLYNNLLVATGGLEPPTPAL